MRYIGENIFYQKIINAVINNDILLRAFVTTAGQIISIYSGLKKRGTYNGKIYCTGKFY